MDSRTLNTTLINTDAIQLKSVPTAEPILLLVYNEPSSADRELLKIQHLSARNASSGLLADIDSYNYVGKLPDYTSSEDLALALDEPQPQKRNGAIKRIIRNLTGKSNRQTRDEEKPQDPTFVRILDQSINVFNTLTGSDSELVKTYDENGNLTRYQFEGESVSWSRDVAARENGD
jgi:hypothetical protein